MKTKQPAEAYSFHSIRLYPYPLIGANRHQDFAVVGNALSNSLHWRDAKKLRDAGLRVIRNAHYPQDPAFMDACDELGLFVIVNTPGWQFWNDEPIFAQRVYSDIRNMVRRDRNHPSVWMWEPILNETWYPEDFAKNVVNICMRNIHIPTAMPVVMLQLVAANIFRFISPIPLTVPEVHSRSWGEIPMLVQAQGYAKTDYQYTCYDALYKNNRQHVGLSLPKTSRFIVIVMKCV